ncbi:MAG TPA: hypothetical protein VF145_09515, partial [Chitinophagaceae bacterium]
MVLRVIIFSLLLLPLAGCELNRREKALQEKEAQLLQKEQELMLKEKTLALKEQELVKREQRLDSTIVDTTLKYSPELPGLWNAKMQCTETTCSGSAVGDTKVETWELSFDSSFHLIARVITGNNIARVYTGSYNGSEILLKQDVAGAAGVAATHLSIKLQLTG